ncbi:hypothetical protein AN189_14875 [Loktanella sp. 3ANDIMAR09]|uniref:hypothetical protein n=1 Tax=Loktanella sp. 3ANDIMAR09 TaxID=1225657 RepID=UPI0006FE16E7|nr:hypothetical protein [Loktanella sp. 3ANDIMAR09]KQI67594.1 hypothetical protein AN189_14875 [Loktanella sp. 3ANDIMAR09]
MVFIDVQNVADEALSSFDAMMVEAAMKVDQIAPLAINIWTEVLKELDVRGKVVLISGSYDDIGNAKIRRLS